MPDNDAIVEALAELRNELRILRRGQLNLTRTVTSMRHELNHRLSTTREELGALVKASHAELAERFEHLDARLDDEHQRLSALEQELDDIFNEGRS